MSPDTTTTASQIGYTRVLDRFYDAEVRCPRELCNFGSVLRRLEDAGVRTPPASRDDSW